MRDEVEEVVARAQEAWDRGDPEEAARILNEFADAHPEEAHRLMGKGRPGPGEQRPEVPREAPASMPCLRCRARMPYRGRLRLHAGDNLAPFLLGDFGELFVDRVDLDAYACLACGHVEVFLPGKAREVGEGA